APIGRTCRRFAPLDFHPARYSQPPATGGETTAEASVRYLVVRGAAWLKLDPAIGLYGSATIQESTDGCMIVRCQYPTDLRAAVRIFDADF
ncbi:MAG: hypothetical protein KDI49_07945, partial [Gammaproteobacteria bacterium]|nr:hypothetical protein [Gammaproteobacteria bacterium]